MKINLKNTTHTELTTLRNQLATVLEESSTSTAELNRLNNKQEKLRAEITAIESGSGSDSAAAATELATKRVQLEQTTKKIFEMSEVDARITVGKEGAIRGVLQQFARAAAAATGPDIEKYIGEIAAAIRPWCQDDATARSLAYRTPAVMLLVGVYTHRFGSFSITVRELQAAIARADEILSGQLNWSFDAKK